MTVFPGNIKETRAEIYKALSNFFIEEAEKSKEWSCEGLGANWKRRLGELQASIDGIAKALRGTHVHMNTFRNVRKEVNFYSEEIKLKGHE